MRAALLAACSLFAAGCASTARPEAPAVIVDPTAQSRAELLEAVTDALGRTDVTLSDDALTRDSILLIERTPARDAAGQRLSGRDFGRPEEFRLMVHSGKCTLVHSRSGKRYQLRHAHCSATPADTN